MVLALQTLTSPWVNTACVPFVLSGLRSGMTHPG
ncbi:hypothetical protein ABIA33_006889 [Streptacidiphilus sp. MAP12-16]